MLPDLVGTLKSFGFDDGLIKDIQSFLTTSATDLGKSVPPHVSSGSFGAAPASVGCLSDANLAREHVHKAVVEMVAGLHGYVEALDLLKSQTSQVTDNAVAVNKQLADSYTCVQDDFSSANGVCALPTGENS